MQPQLKLVAGIILLFFFFNSNAQEWSEWRTVYYGTVVDGEPYAGSVDISFKIRGCKGSPYSFFRLKNSISTQYWDRLTFKFEYIDCDGNSKAETVGMDLKTDIGVKADLGFWFIGSEVTKIFDIKFTKGFDRPKNKSTNPNDVNKVETNEKAGEADRVAEAERQQQNEEEQRQKELEEKRRQQEARAKQLNEQAETYLSNAKDEKDQTAIGQMMNVTQAESTITYQKQQRLANSQTQQQQSEVDQTRTQIVQQGVNNIQKTLTDYADQQEALRAQREQAMEERKRKEQMELEEAERKGYTITNTYTAADAKRYLLDEFQKDKNMFYKTKMDMIIQDCQMQITIISDWEPGKARGFRRSTTGRDSIVLAYQFRYLTSIDAIDRNSVGVKVHVFRKSKKDFRYKDVTSDMVTEYGSYNYYYRTEVTYVDKEYIAHPNKYYSRKAYTKEIKDAFQTLINACKKL